MTLLIETNIPEWMTNEALKAELQPLLPDVEIRHAPDLGDRSEIIMLACVRLPAGLARTLPNLQLVQKIGAGVEAIVGDPDLPAQVQVTRLKPDAPAQEIAEYCVAYVLREQRNMRFHEENQVAQLWKPVGPRRTPETTVGVLGLGHIGARTARTFALLGFRVLGWSRTVKTIDGVDCRQGTDTLAPLLAECDYVASVLPSTPNTRGLFDKEIFASMKSGSILINVGRGDLIVDDDLLAALASGQIGHAVLDVFQAEPLPDAHPFWTHPNVTVTPHVSGWHVGGGLEVIADNYRRLVSGEPLVNLVNRAEGY
ncbi:MAG: glyoxylate/hydroxypyruvate reductase A [Chloroflexota bacterium]